MKEITENMESEVSSLREKHFNSNNEKLIGNKKKIETADTEFRADPNYIKLVE